MTNRQVMTNTELEQRIADDQAELDRRRVVATATDRISAALNDYQHAVGVLDGAPWREPEGYLDAVPPGHTRVFEGDLWRVIADEPVVHSPAVAPDSWELVAENVDPVVPDPDDYPEWEAGMVLETGDIVSYQGDLYELTGGGHTAHEGWNPSVGGYLWRKLT